MKTITTIRFVRVLGKHNITEIEISKIGKFQEKALVQNLWCDFQDGAFLGLQSDYPNEIEISSRAIIIRNTNNLLPRLDNRLLYNKDEELDAKTISIWRTLNAF